MSLWTPDGEIRVNRNPSPQPAPSQAPAGGASGLVGGPDLDDLSPEERAEAEAFIHEMAEVQQQIASTPAAVMIANHAMGIYELAAIKLSLQPPQFGEAQLAIDAMAAVLDAVGTRLGPEGQQLRDALTQLQMAFVELTNRAAAVD